ncbi:MAG: hypothetical protein GY754_22045 [bacterium]|nr:hypothetical protein [bacterium]
MEYFLKNLLSDALQRRSNFENMLTRLIGRVTLNRGRRRAYVEIDKRIDDIISDLNKYKEALSRFNQAGRFNSFKFHYEPLLSFYEQINFQNPPVYHKVNGLKTLVERQNTRDRETAKNEIMESSIIQRANHGDIIESALRNEIIPEMNKLMDAINKMIFYDEISYSLKFSKGRRDMGKDLSSALVEDLEAEMDFFARFDSKINGTCAKEEMIDKIYQQFTNSGYSRKKLFKQLNISEDKFSDMIIEGTIKHCVEKDPETLNMGDGDSSKSIEPHHILYHAAHIEVKKKKTPKNKFDSFFDYITDMVPVLEKAHTKHASRESIIDPVDIITTANRFKFYEENRKTAGLQEVAEVLNQDLFVLSNIIDHTDHDSSEMARLYEKFVESVNSANHFSEVYKKCMEISNNPFNIRGKEHFIPITRAKELLDSIRENYLNCIEISKIVNSMSRTRKKYFYATKLRDFFKYDLTYLQQRVHRMYTIYEIPMEQF